MYSARTFFTAAWSHNARAIQARRNAAFIRGEIEPPYARAVRIALIVVIFAACTGIAPGRGGQPATSFAVPLTSPDDPIATDQATCDAYALRCAELAERYNTGTGVRIDHGRGRQLATRGCDAGDAAACFVLAVHFAQGWGVP